MDRERLISGAVALLAAAAVAAGVSGVSIRSVPFWMIILAATLLLMLAARPAQVRAPGWLQALLVAAVCLGLLPLSNEHLAAGVKEVVRYIAIFGIGWCVFASTNPTERKAVAVVFAGVAVLASLLGIALKFSTFSALHDGMFSELTAARLTLIQTASVPFACMLLLKRRGWFITVPTMLILFALGALNGGLLIAGLAGAGLGLLLQNRKSGFRTIVIAAVPVALVVVFAAGEMWQPLHTHWDDSGSMRRLFLEYEATPAAVATSPVTGHGLGRYRHVIRGFFLRFPEQHDMTIIPDTNSSYMLLAVEAGIFAAGLLALILLSGVVRAALETRYPDSENAAAVSGAALALTIGALFTSVVNLHAGAIFAAVTGMAAPLPALQARRLHHWMPQVALISVAAVACLLAGRSDALLSRVRPQPRTLEIIEPNVQNTMAAAYWLVDAQNPVTAPQGAMRLAEANDASGNRVLAIPDGAGRDGSSVNYNFGDLPAGLYTVWVRAWWGDGCGNSIGCVIGDTNIIITDEIYGRWHWVASQRQVALPGGPTTVTLRTTEDGVMIDQILLTPDNIPPRGIMKPR